MKPQQVGETEGPTAALRRWTEGTRGLVLVVGVAFAARLAGILALGEAVAVRIPLLDAQYYLETAAALAKGAPWPAGPHFMAPVYPAVLSALFRIAPPSIDTVRVFQLILGIATTAMVTLAARRAGPVAGTIAGFLYGLCGPAIVYENQVLMEALLAFCLAAFLWLGGETGRCTGGRAAAAGLAIGVAAAGRPVYALLLPALLMLLARDVSGPRRTLAIVLVLAGFAIPTLPPSVRNWRETGSPSFVSVSGGLNLYIGNNPQARGAYSQPAGLFLDQDPTGARSASAAAGRNLDAQGASRFYADKAWSYLRANPGAWMRLWLRKIGYFFGPDEIPQIEDYNALRQQAPVLYVAGIVGFLLLMPLAFLGATARFAERRTRLLALAIVAAGLVVHVVFFSTGRYRAALLPAFAVLAGWGTVALAAAIGTRAWKALVPIVPAAILFALAPRYDRARAEAWGYHMDALRYTRVGAPRSAQDMYERALRIDPTLGESWHNLGATRASQDQIAEAIADYQKALSILGENPITLYNLGVLHGRLGLDEKALAFLDRAVAADPQDAMTRVDRGVALYRLGRTDAAFADWRRVAAESPGHAALARTLGRLAAAGITLPSDLAPLAAPR